MTETKPDLAVVLDYYNARGRVPGMVSCPLHDDATPSCSTSSDGLWKCHSCGASGDVWTLIEKMEGADFVGAREWAATTLDFTATNAGGPSAVVAGTAYGGRRRVAVGSRGGRKGGGYVPPWRSR